MVLANQNANTFLSGPATGAPAQPSFRAIALADIPTGIPNANLANSVINIAINNTGTSPAWSASSVALGGTITLQLPFASATTDGILSRSDWSRFNSAATGAVTSVNGQVGGVVTLNADSLQGYPIDFTNWHNGWLLSADTAHSKLAFANPASGGGIDTLNGLAGRSQTFATGTSGTDFNIVSSGTTHIFNFPTASASNRGLLSTADFSSFNSRLTGGGGLSPLFSNSLSGTTMTFTQLTTSAFTAYGNFTNATAAPSFSKIPLQAFANSSANTLVGYDGSGNPVNINVTTIGSGAASLSGGVLNIPTNSGGTPAGSTGDVQVNSSGAFATVAGFTANSSSHTVSADSLKTQRLQTNSALFNNAPFAAPTGLAEFDNSYGTFRPCGGSNTYTSLSAATWGLAVTDYSLSSSTAYYAAKQINQHYATNTTSASMVGAVGFNDFRSFGFSNASMYKAVVGAYNAIFAAHFLGTFTVAGSGSSGVTVSGTWTNVTTTAWGGKGASSGGNYTTSNGASLTYSFTDSSVVFGGIGTSANGAQYQLLLDNVLVYNSTTNGLCTGVTDGIGYDEKHVPFTVMFTGLSYGPHTLKVVNTDASTSDTLYVDYFGTLRPASTATPLILLKPNLLDVTGAASGGSVPYVNSAIRKGARTMDSLFLTWNQYYPFYVVPTAIDTLNGICSSDHIHPNSRGDTLEWQKIISIVPSMTSATPWAQYAQGPRRQGVNQNGWIRQMAAYDEVVKYGDEAKYFQNTDFLQEGSLRWHGKLQFKNGNEAAGKLLVSDANGNLDYSNPSSGSPGGSTNNVQYNNSGAFAGSNNLNFDPTNIGLTVGGYMNLSAPNASNGVIMYNAQFTGGGTGYAYINTGVAHKFQFATSGGYSVADVASGSGGTAISGSAWRYKLITDANGKVMIAGNSTSPGTIQSWLDVPASTTTTASMTIPEGVAPTTLIGGQFYAKSSDHTLHWVDGTNTDHNLLAGGGSGSPGGSSGNIQYNNAGAFAGTANLNYDATNVGLIVGGYLNTAAPNASNAIQMYNAQITGGGTGFAYINTGAASKLSYYSSGGLSFGRVASGSAGASIATWQYPLFISATNQVSIGGNSSLSTPSNWVDVPASTSSLASMTIPEGTAPGTLSGGQFFAKASDHTLHWVDGTGTDHNLTAAGTNIYNSDGTLTANRTVTMGTNSLTFTGNKSIFTGSSTPVEIQDGNQGDRRVLVSDASGNANWLNTHPFTQNANGTALTNSTTATDLAGAGIGSTSIAGNTLHAGDEVVVHMSGIISTASSSPGTITISPNVGNGISFTPPTSLSNIGVDITIRSTILTTGTSGTVATEAIISISGQSVIWNSANVSTSTINTTVANTFSVVAQWGTANASNSIQSLPPTTVRIL
jgi:hypothetical protein